MIDYDSERNRHKTFEIGGRGRRYPLGIPTHALIKFRLASARMKATTHSTSEMPLLDTVSASKWRNAGDTHTHRYIYIYYIYIYHHMLSMHVPTSKNNRLCPESSTCLQKFLSISILTSAALWNPIIVSLLQNFPHNSLMSWKFWDLNHLCSAWGSRLCGDPSRRGEPGGQLVVDARGLWHRGEAVDHVSCSKTPALFGRNFMTPGRIE